MALGEHWEWRAFGAVSRDLQRRFESLPAAYPGAKPQGVLDEYLWIPGLEVNAKLRKGVKGQNGLKFKRLTKRRGEFEFWSEHKEEIFEFPLSADAWRALAGVLAPAGVQLPEMPSRSPDRKAVLDALRAADQRLEVMFVEKCRRAKLWQDNVKVEVAEIFLPERVTSVGLESWFPGSGEAPSEDELINALVSAYDGLGIPKEKLRVANYLDAVSLWSGGGEFFPTT